MGDTSIAEGSQGFTPPLDSGAYTFLIQQFGAATTYQFDFVLTGNVAPPQITSINLNGGVAALAGAQHSRVVNVQVTFDQAVQLETNALLLSLHTNSVTFGGAAQATGKGAIPTLVTVGSPDSKTWTVTFTGPDTDVGATDGLASLTDGVYDFKVDATKVHPVGSPSVNVSGSNSTLTFHRLFGDIGDAVASGADFSAVVNTGDNLTFRGVFNNPTTYKAFLDLNGDGIINSVDNLQFRNRFNKTLTWKA
jgi:hypothetical protein